MGRDATAVAARPVFSCEGVVRPPSGCRKCYWLAYASQAALQHEHPKLTAMAVGRMNGKDFATMLDRAIAASGKALNLRQIELKAQEDHTAMDDPTPRPTLVSNRPRPGDFESFDRFTQSARYRQRERWRRGSRLTQRRRPHTLPSGINYTLKLPLASGTGECLSLVFESVFRGRSAPR
jgi:hypothetical protein